MTNKFVKRAAAAFMSLMIIFAALSAVSADVLPNSFFARSNGAKIKVGCHISDGFQNYENGVYSGYNYDYMLALAQYTNWEYEFATGTFSETLARAKSGAVDIISGLLYSDERAEYLDYAETPYFRTQLKLISLNRNNKVLYRDYKSFDGMTVGIIKGSIYSAEFDEYAGANGFSVNYIEYPSRDMLLSALYTEKIDSILVLSSGQIAGTHAVDIFGSYDIYFATAKGNTAVLEQINEGMKKIAVYEKTLEQLLYEKNFGEQPSELTLTAAEQRYVSGRAPVIAAYDPAYRPIEYCDGDNGQYKGIIADLMSLISKKTGLVFETVTSSSRSSTVSQFRNGKASIITSFVHDYDRASEVGVNITPSYLSIPMVRVYATADKTGVRAAFPNMYYATGKYKDNVTSSATIYDTYDECFDALYNNQADFTIVNIYTADYYLSQPKFSTFTYSVIPADYERICIAVSKSEDPLLTTVLSKAILSLSQGEIDTAVSNNLQIGRHVSFLDTFYINPVLYSSLVLLLLLLFALLLVLVTNSVRRQNKILVKKAEDDELYRSMREASQTIVAAIDMEAKSLTVSENISRYFPGTYSFYNDISAVWKKHEYISDADFYKLSDFFRQASTAPDYDKSITLLLTTEAGQDIWFRIDAVRTRNQKSGKTERIILTINNVDEEIKIQNDLRFRAEFDELTGIFNKHSFYELTSKMLLENPNTKYVLLLWNIDHFKFINDLFGIDVGDRVLREMAAKIAEDTKAIGTYARLEGDRFASCIPADKLSVDEMISGLDRTVSMRDINYDVIVNVGIYEIDDITMPIGRMCDRASLALATVRGNYLQRYAYYDDNLRDTMLLEQEIVSNMSDALAAGQFVPYFQPLYSISKSCVVGAEALVRWITPDKGMISPATFIPLFERNGFITKLDPYIWEQVCIFISKRLAGGMPVVPVSINISRINFYNPKLYDILTGLVRKYRINPSYLKLEVTESAYTTNADQLITTLNQLRRFGFQIAMDDFGSGYSSLNMLRKVPVDILKIDMPFLVGIGADDDKANSLLSNIVRMAKWLEMSPVAEGVETKEQAEFLSSIGCDRIQGYYFSRPISLDRFEEMLNTQSADDSTDILKADLAESDFDMVWNSDKLSNIILNNMVDAYGIYELSGDTLEIIRVNATYYQLFGGSAESIFNDTKDAMSWVYEGDREYTLNTIKAALKSGGIEECTFRRHHQSGKLMKLHGRVKHLGNIGGRNLFYISFADVTAKEKNDFYEKLIPYMSALSEMFTHIYRFDFAANTAQEIKYENALFTSGKPQSANECIESIQSRIHAADLISLNFIKDRKSLLAALKKRNGKPVVTPVRILDGEKYISANLLIAADSTDANQNTFVVAIQENAAKSLSLHHATDADKKSGEKSVFEMLHEDDSKKEMKVLVVDDNKINRLMLSKMLSDKYEILEAQDGRQALDILTANNYNISAILLDIVMPIMDGYAFLEQRKQNPYLSAIPVIILSQADSKELEEKAFELNATDFLRKPYDPKRIKQKLETYIGLRNAVPNNEVIEQIVSNIPGGIAVYEIIDGIAKLLFCSRGIYTSKGYTKEEYFTLFGNNMKKVILPSDRHLFDEAIAEAVNTHKSKAVQYRVVNKDSTLNWVELVASYAHDNGVNPLVFATVTDITERVEQAEKLDENQKTIDTMLAKLEVAFKQSPIKMWEYNIEKHMIILDKAKAENIGISKTELSLDEFLDSGYIAADSLPVVRQAYARVDAGEQIVETVIHTKSAQETHSEKEIYTTVFDRDGNPISAIVISFDITNEAADYEMHRSEASLRQVFTRGAEFYFEVDLDANEILAKDGESLPAFVIGSGSLYNLFSQLIEDCVHPEDTGAFDGLKDSEKLKAEIKSGKRSSDYVEVRVDIDKSKRYHWIGITASYVVNPANGHVHIFVVARNVNEKVEKNVELRQRAEKDMMTLLYNRTTFEKFATSTLKSALVAKKQCVFILLDIDNFKNINDTYGHAEGDEVLKYVADTLSRSFRKSELIARFGGDEFAVLLTNVKSAEAILSRVSAVCELINRGEEWHGDALISCSAGIALAPRDGETLDALYKNADSALYYAKGHGKNQCVLYGGDSVQADIGKIISGDFVLDKIDDYVFVCDIETYDLLYMNKACKELCKVDYEIYDHKCYEVLFGRSEPCSHCKADCLSYGDYYVQDFRSEYLKKHLLLREKLISYKQTTGHLHIISNVVDKEKKSFPGKKLRREGKRFISNFGRPFAEKDYSQEEKKHD